MRGACSTHGRKSEGNILLRKLRRRWKDTIRMVLREIG
jgi:hypothetical protein